MEKILILVCALQLVLSGVLIFYIVILKNIIKGLSLDKQSTEQELEEWRERLLEKVKEKIVLTERSELRLISGEDLVSQFIYQHEDIKELGTELSGIFAEQLSSLRLQFPNLTDLDILVISLLGIGMDNVEICTLLHMEKRTLYRRRQLIAMRIGISSTQLDELAMSVLTSEH